MRRGVSSVVGAILLVAVAVSLSAFIYYEITSIFSQTTGRTGTLIEKEFDLALTDLKIVDFGNCRIVVLNTGGTNVPLDYIYIYQAKAGSELFNEVNFSPSAGTINKSESLEINLNMLPGYYKLILKVLDKTVDYGFITCSPIFCEIRSSCEANETPIIALSDVTNARVELPTAGNYPYKLCCSGISSVTYSSTCNPALGLTGLITLSTNSTYNLNTNSRVEKYNYTNPDGFDYKKSVCVNLTMGYLDCIYDTKSNCNAQGYTVYLLSMSGETNARVGDENSYPLVLCCKYG